MKVYSGSEIRNVAVVGHNDTGKTTLVSQLLFNAGAQTRMGRVEDGTTVTDFDLVGMKAYLYQADGSGKFDAGDIPADLKSEADEWREKLIEKVAEGDDTLMEKFFEQGGLSQEDLIDGLKREIAHHQIYPVLLT